MEAHVLDAGYPLLETHRRRANLTRARARARRMTHPPFVVPARADRRNTAGGIGAKIRGAFAQRLGCCPIKVWWHRTRPSVTQAGTYLRTAISPSL